MPVKCPHCEGDGGMTTLVNRGLDLRKHSVEWMRCLTCNGDGVISEQRAALIVEGKTWRDARVARRETLLEASRRLGMDPAELSALEHGHGHPSTFDAMRERMSLPER